MKHRACGRAVLLGALLASVFCAPSRGGGSMLQLPREGGGAVSLEVFKPEFAHEATTFPTSTLFLGAKVRLLGDMSVVAEVPFAHFGRSSGHGEDESALGNPYLGIDMWSADKPSFVEVGARIPAAPGGAETGAAAAACGVIADYVERAEAFLPDVVPMSVAVGRSVRYPSGIFYEVRGALSYWLAMEEQEDSETFFLYAGHLGYDLGRFAALAGIAGRSNWASFFPIARDMTYHHLELGVSSHLGVAQPLLSVRLRLDEGGRDALDLVVRLGVSVTVSGK